MTMLLSDGVLRTPEQLSNLLRRLGPITIKVGQYLALRRDLLPQEFCDDLLKLADKVPAFPWNEAREILTKELGRPPERTFDYIDRTPFASGSLAQVHRARLADGTELAVKIQRPGIDQQVRRDLKRLRRLARVADRVGWRFSLSPLDLIDEVSEWLLREIDFKRELASAQRLYRLAADSKIQRIPEAFPALSAKRVITYEFLDGIAVTSLLSDRGKPKATSAKSYSEDELQQFTENLVEASLTQLFRYRFFHADLHPGNLLMLPGSVVGFVDFGFCDSLDDSVRSNQMNYLTAVYNDDVPGMFRALTQILISSPEVNVEGFRRDFVNDRRALEGRRQTGVTGVDDRRQPVGDYMSTVLNAARRNGYRVPTSILSIYRALLTIETLAAQLGLPDGIQEVGSAFFRDLQQRELLTSMFDRDHLQQFFVSLLNLKRDTPRQINQILTDIAEGTLSVKVEVTEDPRLVKGRNRRASLLATSILAVSVAVLFTRPNLPVLMGVPITWVLIVALIILYISALYHWRRL